MLFSYRYRQRLWNAKCYDSNIPLTASFTFISLQCMLVSNGISLCTVCAMLTCCLLFTILTVLVLGIGIGYHYCFVQNSVEAMAKAAKAAGALRTAPGMGRQGHVMRSVDKAMQRGFAHRLSRRDADTPLTNNNFTLNNNFTDTNNFTVIDNQPPLELTTLNATNFTVF